MIIQSTNVSEVHKLYVNQSVDLHTPVTVPVERDGEYQVSIIAIREGMGILESGVGYTQQVMMHTSVIMSTTAGQPSHISTTPGMKYSIPKCIEHLIIYTLFRQCIIHSRL